MTQDITEEQQSIIGRVEKLLRLAAKNPNEAEAASATSKAQELLAAYNLDMAAVERNSGDTGKRAQEELEGGKYEWERDLWKAVAQLNFCIYWNESKTVATPLSKVKLYVKGKGVVPAITVYQHRIVGRTVNIAGTKAMASYLQSVIERITKERCIPAKINLRSTFAKSFREGLTFGIQVKVWDRRAEFISEEKRKANEAVKAAAYEANAGASTSTAITLSSFVQTEHEENVDFMYGAGTSAKWAADRARKAAAKKAADDEYTQWAAAHPKEAQREEAKRKREREKEEAREARTGRFKGDASAWTAGNDAAKHVSLDLQTEGRRAPAGLLK